MRRGRLLVGACVVAAVVAGSGLAVAAVSGLGEPDADCSVTEAPTLEAALELAEDCDHDVAAVDSYDPWSSLTATPRGTVREEVAAQAVRTDLTGAWAPVDATVVLDASGGLRVASPVYDITLGSSRGNGFLTIADGERSVSVQAPVEVGEPVVDGASVTWPLLDRSGAAIEGATLTAQVHPDATGVTPVIQVDTPEAYAALKRAARGKRVGFQVSGDAGLKVEHPGGSAGFTLVASASGEAVFTGGKPLQWDSSGGVEPGASADEAAAETGRRAWALARRNRSAAPSTTSTTITQASPGAAGAISEVVVPPLSAGDEVAAMDVEVSDDRTVLVSADEDMVSNPDTTWPVMIDPSLSGIVRHEWVQVRSSGSSKYKPTSSEGVGFCDVSSDSACARDFKARLIWEFTGMSLLSKLSSDDVVSASFEAYGTHSYNCAGYQLRAYLMSSGISSSTTWSNQPSAKQLLDTKSPSHRSGQCGAPGYVEWNVTKGVQALAGSATSMTLELRAPTEDSMSSWRRYYLHSVRLSIEYNRAPSVSALKLLVNTTVEGCEGSSGDAPYVLSTTPKLSAVGKDPDGQNVKLTFEVYEASSGTQRWSETTAAAASGSTQTVGVDAGKLVNNGSYRWRVRAKDTDGRLSAYGGWCFFRVDTTKPESPTITPVQPGETSLTIKAVYLTGEERGGVGLTGCFKLARGSTSDTARFEYGFDTVSAYPSSVAVGSDGTATVCHPSGQPSTSGPHYLLARSVDKSGQASGPKKYEYLVAYAREDGVWSFDDQNKSPVPDQSRHDSGEADPAGDLTVDGPTWVTGPHTLFHSRQNDWALEFDGVDDEGWTKSPVFDTRKSFVVSAHVLLDEGSKWRTVIAQEGPGRNAWQLTYRPSSCPFSNWSGGCWMFGIDDEKSGGAWRTVYSPVKVKLGEWTHLTAEVDQNTHKLRLWVCDIGTPDKPAAGEPVLASAAGQDKPWQTDGPVVIGRGQVSGAKADFWDGRIDNVRLFKGEVVAAAKIRRMCQGAEANDFVAGGEDALDPTTLAGQ